ncbi:Hvo_1808 family surface protein [Haloarchaeobius litoreus]|uniref:Hvo_1808 family surface protein n=1 Tax=Haloarchaeobius litoreus TaxID=755306 RepID=A0ABD6DGQ0_9EURY|nr:Hvo_1808 family surface protein [Haloarchaeobius litoreus]
MRRILPVACLVALILLSGCLGLGFGETRLAEPESNRPDPDTDVRGWEDGYWWNDSLPVDASDGLSKPEIEAVTARAMARIERIRGHEFEESVSVEIISRETYREQRSGGGSSPAWREQFWEALFVVDEDTTVDEAFGELYGSSVLGYYSAGDIVIVSDGSEQLRLSRGTLVHELEHALQDQQFGLGSSAETRDARMAASGVVEGDANYVEGLYERRCTEGTWDCVEVPQADGAGGGRSDVNVGLSVATYTPYAAGERFVATLHERGGWDAVDAAFADRPVSTEQLIHPEAYPDEQPATVTVPDRSVDSWRRIAVGGESVLETAGEAHIYSMFWYGETVPREHYTSGEGVNRYTYDHPYSTGWAGDRLVFYTDGDEGAYVWRSQWESAEDAREFTDAYRELLTANGAESRGDGVYVVPDGGFADAFRLVRVDDTVLVVNAPTVGDLDAVHEPGSLSVEGSVAAALSPPSPTGSTPTGSTANRTGAA